MWFRRKPKTEAKPSVEWIAVARFNPISSAVDADLAVARLEAAGIPAVRFPTNALAGAPMGIMGPEPINVLVPADRAEEAREALASRGASDG